MRRRKGHLPVLGNALFVVLLSFESIEQAPIVHALSLDIQSSQSQSLPSRWVQRTAKQRAKTDALLRAMQCPSRYNDTISPQDCGKYMPVQDLQPHNLHLPGINWEDLPYSLSDGPSLNSHKALRLDRKRVQVESLAHLLTPCSGTVVDIACGAGNLALGLAALLPSLKSPVRSIHAIDVNEHALFRLQEQWTRISLANDALSAKHTQVILPVTTQAHDAADIAQLALPADTSMICSLHGCGAVSDCALEIALQHQLPFCISPCCTGKALTARKVDDIPRYGPPTSAQRSGAPVEIVYPRSRWLRGELERQQAVDADDGHQEQQQQQQYSQESKDDINELYTRLAKTADVGLGPQTSPMQREHQAWAKLIVEMDRLEYAREAYNYEIYLVKMPTLLNDENNGKMEILLGVPRGSVMAEYWKTMLG
jgi:Methyltransferase domain